MKTFKIQLNRIAEISVQADLTVEAPTMQEAMAFAKGAVVKEDWYPSDFETLHEWCEAKEVRRDEEDE